MSLPIFQSQGPIIFPSSLSPYVAAVVFESLLYGIYIALFFACLLILSQRGNVIHWFFAVAMFALATADISYTYYLVFARLLGTGLTLSQIYPKYPLAVTNNSLAGGLLIYRFFIVWGSKKRFTFAPAVLLLGGTVCGYLFEGPYATHSWIYLCLTCSLNFIVTLLTAGRLWWVARASRSCRLPSPSNNYNIFISIIVETGMMYCVYIILDLALQRNQTANIILDAGLIQVTGIMQTLIIVRVGLQRVQDNLKDPESNISSLICRKRSTSTFGTASSSYSFSQRHASPPKLFYPTSPKSTIKLLQLPLIQITNEELCRSSVSLTCDAL